MHRHLAWIALVSLAGFAGAEEAAPDLRVEPAEILLHGPSALHGFLVTAATPDGRVADATREARAAVSDPGIAVLDRGLLRAIADGEAELVVTHGGRKASARIRVTGTAGPTAPSYRHEVVPIFTRYGCNQGGCHGKEAGQNGFKLSLRGFAPEQDYERLVVESLGRRIDLASPEHSLLLAKPSGRVPHRGGTLLAPDSRPYRRLADWMESAVPGIRAEEPALERVEILGGGRVLRAKQEQPLLVRAHFADGSVRDVTWLCQFYVNDRNVLEVSAEGRVLAKREGATAVRAHYQDKVAVAAFTVPHDRKVDPASFAERPGEIDRHVFAMLEAMRIPPSAASTDEEFVRRAFLDTIGTLPSPEEAAAFLSDGTPGKRARLADALLSRPEFVDFWALQLSDLLQNRKERDHDVRGSKGVRSFHQWLREQVAVNRPWNAMARDILLARGDTTGLPQLGYFVVTVGEHRQAEMSDVSVSVAQSFLGTRLLCAKCHNHPDERYTQDDYYHFAAYFSRISLDRQAPAKGPTALSVMGPEEREARKRVEQAEKDLVRFSAPPDEKSEEESKKTAGAVDQKAKQIADARKQVEDARKKPVRISQPRTRKQLDPQPLDRTAVAVKQDEDPRKPLVDWMTDPGNEYFSGSMVNRVWKHFMGAGLVEPVDDLRPSNPPTNPELWRHLTGDFAKDFDLRRLMRQILVSRAYQLSSATAPENESDRRFYSHYYPKRMAAEVLLDAISRATGVPDSFAGYPVGVRAIQLPDPGMDSYFLELFGRSNRVTACACEREGDVTLPQLMHLQNGDSVLQKIRSPQGRLAGLAKSKDGEILETLFLATLSRRPRESEKAAVAKLLAGGADQDEVRRDLFWALLNSKEFVFNH